jgi:hypothetical protein
MRIEVSPEKLAAFASPNSNGQNLRKLVGIVAASAVHARVAEPVIFIVRGTGLSKERDDPIHADLCKRLKCDKYPFAWNFIHRYDLAFARVNLIVIGKKEHLSLLTKLNGIGRYFAIVICYW